MGQVFATLFSAAEEGLAHFHIRRILRNFCRVSCVFKQCFDQQKDLPSAVPQER